jgi:hypothetical protein
VSFFAAGPQESAIKPALVSLFSISVAMFNTLKALLLLPFAAWLSAAQPIDSYAWCTDPTGEVQGTTSEATQWLAYLTQELGLDADQQKQIEPTLNQAAQSLATLKSQPAQTETTPAQVVEALNQSIASLLKPEQQTKFAQIADAWKARLIN